MKQLLSNSCTCCGYEGPTYISVVGPHIRQSCGACGQYVKFLGVAHLPPLLHIKEAIFGITQDLEYIERQKIVIGFPHVRVKDWLDKVKHDPNNSELAYRLATLSYYRLYKHIYNEVERKQLYTGELF